MINNAVIDPGETTDAELVKRSTAGDRDAFGEIVARYQTLVCSLTYNATGNVASSEDLAQETFITAWKHLCELREPEKLRSWLCGVARNLINSRRRNLEREPVHCAEELDSATGMSASEPWPSDAAIEREHQAILWKALERVPETYREPLILYYRHHRSIERVASDLGLSVDAVKQRLSRGRKLLHEQVIAFVEGALEQSAPGSVFTLGVVGALPLLASASVVTGISVSLATAKSGIATLGTKFLVLLNLVIGPIMGLLAAWLSMRASIEDTRTPQERGLVKRHYLLVAAGVFVFTLVSIPLNILAKRNGGLDPVIMGFWLVALAITIGFAVALALRLRNRQRLMRHGETPGTLAAESAGASQGRVGFSMEYRSRWAFLGLPLIAISIQERQAVSSRPALGWIAIGNYAFGVVFAWGGVAVGAVSGGAISVGLVSIGAISIGFLALGLLAMGAYAMGGVALGSIACGAFSFGWLAAEGRYAVAHEFALGVHAVALHANDSAAEAFFAAHPWFDLRSNAGRGLFSLIWVPSILVVVGHWFLARKRRAKQPLASPNSL